MTNEAFISLVLSLSGTESHPHFDRIAFKVSKKTIYASLLESAHSANIKLTSVLQSEFCELNSKSIYPVPNKFGLQGWTTFEISALDREIIFAAVEAAYQLTLKNKKTQY